MSCNNTALADNHVHSMQVREVARRVQAAASKPTSPQKCLGARTQVALDTILMSDTVERAAAAVEAMAWGTTYSRSACKWVVAGGALEALTKLMQACQRSKLHTAMLASIMRVFGNVLSQGAALPLEPEQLAHLVPALTDVLWRFRCAAGNTSVLQQFLIEAWNCLEVVAALHCTFQHQLCLLSVFMASSEAGAPAAFGTREYNSTPQHACRDSEDTFTDAAKLLRTLQQRAGVFAACSKLPHVIHLWDGINRVMQGRLKIEGQYLAQLETKKGSDVGAEQATRRLIARKNQFVVLKSLTNEVRAQFGAEAAEADAMDTSRGSAAPEGEKLPLQDINFATFTLP